MLEPGGVFVLEKRPAETMPATPLWEITRARRYGATEVLFLQPAGNSVTAGPS
jgi:16S rRNA G966 N2-methylase RsmD